jgi:predicted nucleic acid-binding protein
VSLLRARGRRGLSLVDCASFVIMRRYGITRAMAFDEDFAREGFEIYSA